MPLNEARLRRREPIRRDSWPPTILRLDSDNDNDDLLDIPDIDLNPFSYFLTVPEEPDDEIEDLSAGIESDEENAPIVREVSPSSLQRIQDDLEDDESYLALTTQDAGRGFALPVTLQDFTKTHLSERDQKISPRAEESSNLSYGHIPPTPTLRGRRTVRLLPSGGRGRGQTRSLPRSRPRSWREPSPDVWSIPEEEEEQEEERPDDSTDIISPLSLDDSKASAKQPFGAQALPSQHNIDEQTATTTSSKIDDAAMPTTLKKLRKKVRFVLPTD